MKRFTTLHPAWIAGAIGLLATLWLASGLLVKAESETAAVSTAHADPVSVRVVNSSARERVRETQLSARTQAVRKVQLRAETAGKIAQVLADRGEQVQAGQLLIRLAPRDREAQLSKAQAVLKQRQIQHNAAQRLHREGHQSDIDFAQAEASLAAAQAEVSNRADDLAATEIRAPFGGVLESRPVEVGQFVNPGDELGLVMQTQPFLIQGEVTEDVIGHLRIGQPGTAMIHGEKHSGELRFAARQADARTRTFEVELRIPNPDGLLIDGVSAVLRLPLDTVRAHELPSVMLTLNDVGDFGIKTVNPQGLVEFHPAQIAQSEQDAVWLTGLPDTLQVISVGQGFVSAGQPVKAILVDR